MVILDISLMALVSVAIVSLLSWSICAQHRDIGCEHLRVGRRPQVKVRGVSPDAPEVHLMSVRDVRSSA